MTSVKADFKLGILIGLIAYASVALFYASFDALAARGTLFTVQMLGEALFHGQPDASVLLLPIPLDLTVIGGYNAVHLVLSLLIGQSVVALIHHAGQHPSRGPVILALIVGGFVVTILGVGWLSSTIRSVLPWWSIIAANFLATLVSALVVLKLRPGLLDRLLKRTVA